LFLHKSFWTPIVDYTNIIFFANRSGVTLTPRHTHKSPSTLFWQKSIELKSFSKHVNRSQMSRMFILQEPYGCPTTSPLSVAAQMRVWVLLNEYYASELKFTPKVPPRVIAQLQTVCMRWRADCVPLFMLLYP